MAFDLQEAATPDLRTDGSGPPQYGWQSEDPFVAAITFSENTTAAWGGVPPASVPPVHVAALRLR